MKSIESVFNEVLKDITPTVQELALIQEITAKLTKLLEKKAVDLNLKYTQMEPQGSTGIKQTQLRNNFDIDFFIGLDYDLYKNKYKGLSKNKFKKESKRDFLDLCNSWIIPALNNTEFKNPQLLYAEHPYISVSYKIEIIIKIDIVLYFDLPLDFIQENGPLTAVDRSPWHGRFIRDNLSEQQRNDVRLLKQFFKANHSYGDKSALGRGGFIGYSSELLIYHFKTLENLFRNFNTLEIKPLDYYGRSLNQLRSITHFENDALIIIDPIDKNRNVASAISKRAYRYCNQKIQEFLKNPEKNYFVFKEISEATLSGLVNYYILEFKQVNNDIHYTILRDKLHSLAESIKANGEKEFSRENRFGKIIYEIYFENENKEYNIIIHCQKSKISSSYLRKGPPVNEITHSEKFKKKNPNYFIKDGYLWVEEKRKYTEFLVFLKSFIKNKIPDGLSLTNLSEATNAKTHSAKKGITVLKNMVLPFYCN